MVSGGVCVSYITLAGSGSTAGGPQSVVGLPLGTYRLQSHGLIIINWWLHACVRSMVMRGEAMTPMTRWVVWEMGIVH